MIMPSTSRPRRIDSRDEGLNSTRVTQRRIIRQVLTAGVPNPRGGLPKWIGSNIAHFTAEDMKLAGDDVEVRR